MARRHRNILAKLDPVAVNRYQITEKDIRTIEQYLKIIQQDLKVVSTWQDIIDFPGPYATGIAIHEIVEIRHLQVIRSDLLKLKMAELRNLLGQNVSAHAMGIFEEHTFLQEYIQRTYQQHFEVATLIQANRSGTNDLEQFLESDIGVYILEEDRVTAARQIIAELKGEVPHAS